MVTTIARKALQAPIDQFLPLLKGSKSYTKRDGSSKNYTARCPAHNDSNASLMIWEDMTDGHVGVKCWAGCSRKAICNSLSIAETDLYVKDGRFEPRRQTQKIALIDVAKDKWIHPHLLTNWGIQEGYTHTTSDGKKVYNTLKIAYYTMDGSEHTKIRIRKNLGSNGWAWEGDGPIIPYGLDQLSPESGPLVIPEGESDVWTLRQWGFHALGIPGVEQANCLQTEHIAAFPSEVCIIKEPPSGPGKPDSGKKFVENVTARLVELEYQGKVRIVDLQASHGVKDPNALNQKLFAEECPQSFKTEFQNAMDAAPVVDIYAPKEEPATKFEEIQAKIMDDIEQEDSKALYDLAEDIVELDTREQSSLITDIKVGMKKCKEFSWRTFKDRLKDAQKEKEKKTRAERVRVSGKAQIVLGKQLSEETDEALDALYKANHPPFIFVQDGRLVRICVNERGETGLEHYTEDSVLSRLSRVAEFYTYNEGSDSFSNTHPSAKLARQILAQGSWKFPAIEGIIETPSIRPDGTILDTPGYDAQTKLYYVPQQGFQNCKVPNNPSELDIKAAIAVLEDLIADFCFAEEKGEDGKGTDQPNRANALGLMITPIVRPAIKRHVPLALIDAPKQGTGKGLLSDIVSIIATGKPATIMVAPQSHPKFRDNDNEWDKRITSLLMQGTAMITIDNIPAILQSASLDAALTSDYYTGRILGQSKMGKFPQRATWVATGNNIIVGGDLARRCYRVRLDSKMSQPWNRTGFRHEDLATYVLEHRSEIIAAILTLIRAWFAAGRPVDKSIPAMATFTGWARMVGSILDFAGIEGFLTNLKGLYDSVDDDNTQWAAFLEAWHKELGEEYITVADLVQKIFGGSAENIGGSDAGVPLAETLPEYLQVAQKEKPNSFKLILGKALEKRKEACFGDNNLRLERIKDTHKNTAKWRVICGSAGVTPIRHAERECFFDSEENSEREKTSEFGESYRTHSSTPANSANSKDAQNGFRQPGKLFGEDLATMQTNTPSDALPRTPADPDAIPEERREFSLADFWAAGKKHSYPAIPDLDLKSGMTGWNTFRLQHMLRIPDVVRRLG